MKFVRLRLSLLYILVFNFYTLLSSAQPDNFMREIVVELNDEDHYIIPNLAPFEFRIEFPAKDIHRVEITTAPGDTKCYLWSDENFASYYFKGPGGINLPTPFASATRLYCFEYERSDENHGFVMVQDIHGNEEIVELTESGGGDYYGIKRGKMKMPLAVQRAIPLDKKYACRLRSRKRISDYFGYKLSMEMVMETWSEPFQGAIEVYCFQH